MKSKTNAHPSPPNLACLSIARWVVVLAVGMILVIVIVGFMGRHTPAEVEPGLLAHFA